MDFAVPSLPPQDKPRPSDKAHRTPGNPAATRGNSSSLSWTTEDELLFVRGIYHAGKTAVLAAYIVTAQCRIWHGIGMNVDPNQVILQAQDWLNVLLQLEKEKAKAKAEG